jgi:hypothetical protein
MALSISSSASPDRAVRAKAGLLDGAKAAALEAKAARSVILMNFMVLNIY